VLGSISRNVSSKNTTQIPWTGKLRGDHAEQERSYAQGVEHSRGGRGPWAAGAGDKRNEAQLQCVSADIALQSKVLGQIRTDCGCRMCWGDVERGRGGAEADGSDMEASQSPSARPLYYF